MKIAGTQDLEIAVMCLERKLHPVPYNLPKEIKRRQWMAADRRLAALHEAGHYLIGQWAGVREHGALIVRCDPDDILEDKAWLGQYICSSRSLPGYHRSAA